MCSRNNINFYLNSKNKVYNIFEQLNSYSSVYNMKRLFLKNKSLIIFTSSLLSLVVGFIVERVANIEFTYSLFTGSSFYHSLSFVSFLLYIFGIIILYPDLIIDFVSKVKEKEFFNESLLMIISSIGAISLLEFKEAILILLFRIIGEFLEDYANTKAKKSVSSLLNSLVFNAHLLKNNQVIEINPKEIAKGNILEIRPGENIPCDGIIIKGQSSLNLSSLSGESLPKLVKEGDSVLSGSINIDSVIVIEATRSFSSSTFSKILKLVEEEEILKSKHQSFMDKFSKIYIPIILGISITYFLISYSLSGFTWLGEKGGYTSLIKAISILLIGCPCSLIISIPLSFYIGIGKASRIGIIIKNASSIESLNKTKTFAFDKTGTLTKGEFKLINKDLISKENLIIASSLESKINHPIAKAICKEEETRYDVSSFKNHPGHGVEGIIKNKKYYLGSKEFLLSKNIKLDKEDETGKKIYLANERKVIEEFTISDEIKESAFSLLSFLDKEKLEKLLIISGDNELVVKEVADKLQVEKYYSQVLPDEKVRIIKENKPIVYVGDGINDSPSLLSADVGISMGQIGSDIALESSDVIICDDSLEKVYEIKRLSKYIIYKIYFGILLSLTLKLLIFLLISLNIISSLALVFSAIADTGTMVIAILNALLIYKYKPKYLNQD